MEITGVNEMMEETIAMPPGKVDFELYSCFFCGRLLSPEQEKKAFKTGILCVCGSNKYRAAKSFQAEQLPNGDYLCKGPFGEEVTVSKEAFEEAFETSDTAAARAAGTSEANL